MPPGNEMSCTGGVLGAKKGWVAMSSSATSLPLMELNSRKPSLPSSLESCSLLDPTPGSRESDVDAAVFSKLNWRLLPLFWLTVILSYVDRTNLAFASIQLNKDLGFTPAVYGLGSGLFFATYALLQVPSNLILRRVGGPAWLSFLIGAWGVTASSFALMRTSTQFYWLRALLGLTESGAFPGMWLMLSRFYPPDQITFAYAVIESGITLSHTIAGPLAASILALDGLGGLQGWQWLFFLEGLPSVLLALAMWRLLPNSPAQATFLTPAEQKHLTRRLATSQSCAELSTLGHAPLPSHDEDDDAEQAARPGPGLGTGAGARPGLGLGPGAGAGAGAGCSTGEAVWAAVTNKHVWFLGGTKILRDMAGFGIIFFTPLIVKALLEGKALSLETAAAPSPSSPAADGSQGYSRGQATRSLAALVAGPAGFNGSSADNSGWAQGRGLGQGGPGGWAEGHDAGVRAALLTSVPFAAAAAMSFWVAHRSQREGERILHVGLPFLLCGLAFMTFPLLAAASPVAGFLCVSAGIMGVYSGSAPSLALLNELAAGPGLVVALPLYNAVGNLGGFIGPYVVGLLLASTHSFAYPTLLMGASLACAGLLMLLMPRLMRMPKRYWLSFGGERAHPAAETE
ncbi:major facilitator superfamily domain-containing protein [Haematococcus lacustris]